jgi:hypothetical protein
MLRLLPGFRPGRASQSAAHSIRSLRNVCAVHKKAHYDSKTGSDFFGQPGRRAIAREMVSENFTE